MRSQLFLLAAVIAGVGWLGCATNGDAGENEPEPATSGTATSKPDPGTRPDFEAGFPDEPDSGTGTGGDPTPPGGGDTCVDNGDPGGAENVAKMLPNTDDAQNTAISVSGVVNGAVDVDFYKLHVEDKSFHLLQPDLEATSSGVEMCVFVRCDTTGASGVTCSAPAVAKKSDLGTDGCCATGPAKVTPGWDCNSTTDSATLFIRIKQTVDKCEPYSFSYAF
ncbi:MAG: hypothetical protein JWP87_529 [Labilithrix sp.]|nr:hypothetical protein [Labilithrix sp.]